MTFCQTFFIKKLKKPVKTEDLYDHKYDDKAKLQFQFWAIKNSEKHENFFNSKKLKSENW